MLDPFLRDDGREWFNARPRKDDCKILLTIREAIVNHRHDPKSSNFGNWKKNPKINRSPLKLF